MRFLFLVTVAALFAAPVSAQEWTAEQQSLIDHVTTCWDVWVEALADETPDRFFDACPQDEGGHYWWTADGAPDDLIEGLRRNWHVIREVDDDWVSLRPCWATNLKSRPPLDRKFLVLACGLTYQTVSHCPTRMNGAQK